MYDKMNTCNDWRVGCKGRFQTSARLCCQSQSQGSTPVDNVSRSWMCNTLIMTVTYEENKIRDDKSPDREPLLLPYSLSELQTVESDRT